MDPKVKKRLIGALILIGLVLICVPIVFHNDHKHANMISLTPVAPPAPALPAVENLIKPQAKALAEAKKEIAEQIPQQKQTN